MKLYCTAVWTLQREGKEENWETLLARSYHFNPYRTCKFLPSLPWTRGFSRLGHYGISWCERFWLQEVAALKRNICPNAHQVQRMNPSECHLFSHITIQLQMILLPISVADINKFHSKFKNALLFKILMLKRFTGSLVNLPGSS